MAFLTSSVSVVSIAGSFVEVEVGIVHLEAPYQAFGAPQIRGRHNLHCRVFRGGRCPGPWQTCRHVDTAGSHSSAYCRLPVLVTELAIRGQYLGRTKSGAVVVRYQNGKFGALADTLSNHYLRQFAIVNGSK